MALGQQLGFLGQPATSQMMTKEEWDQNQREEQARARASAPSAPAPKPRFMGEQAPQGWEFNPNAQYAQGMGGLTPMIGEQRFLRTGAPTGGTDPNRDAYIPYGVDGKPQWQPKTFDPRIAAQEQSQTQAVQQSLAEGHKRALLQPLLIRLMQQQKVMREHGQPGLGFFNLLGIGGQQKPIEIKGIQNIEPQRAQSSNLLSLLGRINFR